MNIGYLLDACDATVVDSRDVRRRLQRFFIWNGALFTMPSTIDENR